MPERMRTASSLSTAARALLHGVAMLVTCPPRGVRRIPTRGARGSAVQDENANRLLRQYLAKSADLRRFSLRDLDDIAERINTRPRHVLDWATAAEMLPRVRESTLQSRSVIESRRRHCWPHWTGPVGRCGRPVPSMRYLCHVLHVDRGRSVLRAPGGPVDLDRHAGGGPRVDQVKRCVRAGVGE